MMILGRNEVFLLLTNQLNVNEPQKEKNCGWWDGTQGFIPAGTGVCWQHHHFISRDGLEGDGASQERTLISGGLDCRIGNIPSLECFFFRDRDVFESRVIKINRCRWDRNRAITLSGWASGVHVWVSSCSVYSILWWEDMRREGSTHFYWA